MIVVDASVVLELLLQTPTAGRLSQRAFAQGESLHASHLLDIELAQALRRFARLGDISPERGALALEFLADFPIRRYPHREHLPRIWQLRHNLTAYDAAYLALAKVLDASLVTRDGALASVRCAARVEVL